MDRFPLFITAVVGTVIILLGGLIYAGIRGERAWKVYAEEHDCNKTGNSETYVTMTPIMAGKVMVMQPITHHKYEWKCETPEEIVWR